MKSTSIDSVKTRQSFKFPTVPRVNLATQAANIIRAYIVREQLESGHRLPSERRFSDWLNVSRTVLRDAIAQLVEEGIIYRPSPNTLCVADYDRGLLESDLASMSTITTEQRELVELRAFIEVGALNEIIDRMTSDHLAEIERWVIDGERRLNSSEPTYRADAKFHTALLRVLNNSAINKLLPMIQESMRLYLVSNPYQLTWAETETVTAIVNEHRLIYEAIKAKDLVAASELMRLHHQRNVDAALKIREELNTEYKHNRAWHDGHDSSYDVTTHSSNDRLSSKDFSTLD